MASENELGAPAEDSWYSVGAGNVLGSSGFCEEGYPLDISGTLAEVERGTYIDGHSWTRRRRREHSLFAFGHERVDVSAYVLRAPRRSGEESGGRPAVRAIIEEVDAYSGDGEHGDSADYSSHDGTRVRARVVVGGGVVCVRARARSCGSGNRCTRRARLRGGRCGRRQGRARDTLCSDEMICIELVYTCRGAGGHTSEKLDLGDIHVIGLVRRHIISCAQPPSWIIFSPIH